MARKETDSSGPKIVRYFAPVVAALKELGGSAQPAEVRDFVATDLGISDEEQAELLPSGSESRFANSVRFAHLYLAKAGIIDTSQRGVWTLTEKGRSLQALSDDASTDIYRSVRSQSSGEAETSTESKGGTKALAEEDTSSESNHRARVIKLLQALPPAGFERFAQRLLRESGFQRVNVTGRSGDGGIDGDGILEVNPLVSFKVLFQCKRHIDSVSVNAGDVRDFRGAMTGRTDKGIILTTSTFTAAARTEAARDGAPSIELVDGEKLVDMLANLRLGLKPARAYLIDESFFADFRS